MADERFEKAKAFVDNLKGRRTGREEEWRQLAEWIAPHRGIFTGEDASPRHERRNRDAFTQIASQALLRGASGMTSGMTPRNVSWFKPDFIDGEMSEASGARAWLDAFDMRMKDCLADGGFYQAIQAFNMDLLWAGCAMLYCERGEAASLRFECVQIGTFWVELNEEGRVDAAAREFMLTPAIMAEKFGEEALSERSREYLKSRPYEPVRITHLARRREMDAEAPPGKREMAYESLFWEEGGRKFLHEGGFYEMPYFFTRWHEGVMRRKA